MKFVVLGRYTEQGLGGFVKNPSDNRQEAAKKITEAAGAKLIEMMTLRGAYDFIAIVEGSNFETAAGMKMLMEATGTIKDMTIMESVNFNKAAEIASKAAASYKKKGEARRRERLFGTNARARGAGRRAGRRARDARGGEETR